MTTDRLTKSLTTENINISLDHWQIHLWQKRKKCFSSPPPWTLPEPPWNPPSPSQDAPWPPWTPTGPPGPPKDPPRTPKGSLKTIQYGRLDTQITTALKHIYTYIHTYNTHIQTYAPISKQLSFPICCTCHTSAPPICRTCHTEKNNKLERKRGRRHWRKLLNIYTTLCPFLKDPYRATRCVALARCLRALEVRREALDGLMKYWCFQFWVILWGGRWSLRGGTFLLFLETCVLRNSEVNML